MNGTADPKEIIRSSVRLKETLLGYLSRDTWTPAEGAMLLAGLHAPANCTEIQAGAELLIGGVNFRDDHPFSEARNTLQEWKNWCDEYDEARAEGDAHLYEHEAPFEIPEGEQPEIPERFRPQWFIHWFLVREIKQRSAQLNAYRWVEPFVELTGLLTPVAHVPFAVALYAEGMSSKLETIRSALGPQDPPAYQASGSNSNDARVSPLSPSDVIPHASGQHEVTSSTHSTSAPLTFESGDMCVLLRPTAKTTRGPMIPIIERAWKDLTLPQPIENVYQKMREYAELDEAKRPVKLKGFKEGKGTNAGIEYKHGTETKYYTPDGLRALYYRERINVRTSLSNEADDAGQ